MLFEESEDTIQDFINTYKDFPCMYDTMLGKLNMEKNGKILF